MGIIKKKKEKQIFWDYDLKKADTSKPEIKKWFLSRKIRFGDFSNIKKSDLKKYLQKLEISGSMKELLKNYLKSNA